jgi:hypothetical protein
MPPDFAGHYADPSFAPQQDFNPYSYNDYDWNTNQPQQHLGQQDPANFLYNQPQSIVNKYKPIFPSNFQLNRSNDHHHQNPLATLNIDMRFIVPERSATSVASNSPETTPRGTKKKRKSMNIDAFKNCSFFANIVSPDEEEEGESVHFSSSPSRQEDCWPKSISGQDSRVLFPPWAPYFCRLCCLFSAIRIARERKRERAVDEDVTTVWTFDQ